MLRKTCVAGAVAAAALIALSYGSHFVWSYDAGPGRTGVPVGAVGATWSQRRLIRSTWTSRSS